MRLPRSGSHRSRGPPAITPTHQELVRAIASRDPIKAAEAVAAPSLGRQSPEPWRLLRCSRTRPPGHAPSVPAGEERRQTPAVVRRGLMPRVLLVERSALLRSAFRRLLQEEPDIAVVAEASNAGDAASDAVLSGCGRRRDVRDDRSGRAHGSRRSRHFNWRQTSESSVWPTGLSRGLLTP